MSSSRPARACSLRIRRWSTFTTDVKVEASRRRHLRRPAVKEKLAKRRRRHRRPRLRPVRVIRDPGISARDEGIDAEGASTSSRESTASRPVPRTGRDTRSPGSGDRPDEARARLLLPCSHVRAALDPAGVRGLWAERKSTASFLPEAGSTPLEAGSTPSPSPRPLRSTPRSSPAVPWTPKPVNPSTVKCRKAN